MNSWYAGYADRYDINRGLLVKYVDGDKRYHDLTTTTYHVLTEADDSKNALKKKKFTESEVDTVRSTLECIICYEVFTDPHSLPCTHTFCKACIQESFKNSSCCPMCKRGFVLREARPNPTMKILCDLFTPSQTTSTTNLVQSEASSEATTSTTTSLSVLSSNPLHALAQITGAGTYKCSTCGGRKTVRNHKCARPCPQYM